MRKLQGLIATADHPNTPPAEASTARAMAEALMIKYRIEEITAKPEHGGAEPVWRDIFIAPTKGEFSYSYRTLLSYIVSHFDCMTAVSTATRVEEGVITEAWWVAHVVGYESDLRFIELLFTSAGMAFGERLEPSYRPDESEQVNAYRMRMAGMEGRRIAMAIYGRDDKNLRPKVRALFKKESLARGENPEVLLGQGNSVKAYREAYAEGFVSEMWQRLYTMRKSRDRASTDLVLAGRGDRIREAFYERYPHLAPKESIGDGYNEGECAKCKKAKSGYCREHAWRRPRKRQERSLNRNGYYNGQSAARAVDLGNTNREVTQ